MAISQGAIDDGIYSPRPRAFVDPVPPDGGGQDALLMRTWTRLAPRVIGALALMAASSTFAQQATLQISAGPLSQSLETLSRQTGMQLLFAPALIAGKRSRAMSGSHPPQEALATLLKGSGLYAEQVAADAFVIKAVTANKPPKTSTKPATGFSRGPTTLSSMQVHSTVPRTQIETSQPITVIDRQRIEESGYQTVFDLLRSQPGIRVDSVPIAGGDAATYLGNGLSGATGAASVSLYGLGAHATALLVDGQRVVSYGLTQGEFNTVTDLNSIPLARVERIEILRDGASLRYGADAMAGAVNIVLRKQLDGGEVGVSSGISSRADANQHRVFGSFGGELLPGIHALLSVDFLNRQPLLNRDRAWTGRKPTNLSGDAFAFAFVGNGFVQLGEICRVIASDAPCDPTPNAQTTLQNGLANQATMLRLSHQRDGITFYGDLLWASQRQHQQSAPATFNDYTVGDDSASLRQKFYSFDDIGPVRNHTRSRATQWTLGANGELGRLAWDLRFDHQSNQTTEQMRGLVVNDAPSYGYVLGGNNDASVLKAISPPLVRRGNATRRHLSGLIEGTLADTRRGPIQLIAGVTATRERLSDRPDPLLLQGDIFQIQRPSHRTGRRSDVAAFSELQLPLPGGITTQLGLRLETNQTDTLVALPRLGFTWELDDQLSLRGSWGLGYRAPPRLSLRQAADFPLQPQLYTIHVSQGPCRNHLPPFPGDEFILCRLDLTTTDNPKLRAERSRSGSIGIVVAPSQRLGMTLDLYQLDRRDEVGGLPMNYAAQHPERLPQMFVRDEQGRLTGLQMMPVNLGRTRLRTIDTHLTYQLPTARHGQFGFDLSNNWLLQMTRQFDPRDAWMHFNGYLDQPRVTTMAHLTWRYDAWRVSAIVRHTGGYRSAAYREGDTDPFAEVRCSSSRWAPHCQTPAFTLLDTAITYGGWHPWTLGLTVQNLLDHKPRYYGETPLTYSQTFDDVVGRYAMFSVRFRF